VRTGLLASSALIAGALQAAAQDATWNLNGTGDFNTAGNWSPATVPTGTAFFGTSNQTNVSFSDTTVIGGWTFNAGASNYNIDASGIILIFNGAGIVINGGSATISQLVSGNLQFLNSSTAGSATFNIAGGIDRVIFRDTSTAGNATINNNFFTEFFGSSTAANATITNNFVLSFGNTSTAGNATINNNFQIDFMDSSTGGNATINNAGAVLFQTTSTGGTARLINGPAGIIDLSALTGAGITAGSIEGGGRIDLGAANLAVGGNNLSTTFSGILKDGGNFGGTGGSLTKTGTGTLTLTGASTYTGATAVNGGALIVNGSLSALSAVAVNNGGTLGGTGTVGNTRVNGGGALAPGAPGAPGTSMTLAGNLAFQPGGSYLVQLNPSVATVANVAGAATLTGGTVQAVLAPGSYLPRSYDILHAGSGLGGTTFSGASSSNPNFAVGLSYSATDVFLNVTGALGSGLGRNQQNAAGVINGFFNNGALPPNFLALFGLTGGNLDHALSLASGEAATGAQQGVFRLGSQFLGLMLDPFVDGRGGPGGGPLGFAPEREALPEDIAAAYAKVMKAPVYKAVPGTLERRWTAWGGAFGGYNSTSGDSIVAGTHDVTAGAGGFAAGLDYHVGQDAVVGLAVAGGATTWDLAQGLGGGKSDAFQAGVYSAARSGPAYVAGSLAFAEHWMSTERSGAFGDRLTASFNAQSVGARVESGYRFAMPAFGVTPYAALQAQSFHTPTYGETDVNGTDSALNYSARTAYDVRSELGARFDHLAHVDPTAVLTLRGRLAWAHDWISDPSLSAVFQALPGASFVVTGALPGKDAALASAGAELRLVNGVTLIGNFSGEFSGHAQTYAATGTLRWAW
jgi:autotransporter-associated beta strand protein